MAAADEHLVDILEPPLYLPSGETQGIVPAIRAGAWLHTTDVWIYRTKPELQILFQQRSPVSPTYAGKLDCSVAGYLEAGETGKQGGVREVAEELGIRFTEDDLQDVGRRLNAMIDHRGRERKIVANKNIALWNHELEELVLSPGEVHAAFWVSAKDLLAIETGAAREIHGIDPSGTVLSKIVTKEDFAYNLDDYYFRMAERIVLISGGGNE